MGAEVVKRLGDDLCIRHFGEADVPYVIDSHLAFYAREYGFTSAVWQGYVRGGVRALVDDFDPERDCLLILEQEGQPRGSIAIAHTDEGAQLRFFLLDPAVQGRGAGGALIDEAIRFCKEAGHKKVFLWTFHSLDAARYLYKKAGFAVTESVENNDWGTPIVEERWDMAL